MEFRQIKRDRSLFLFPWNRQFCVLLQVVIRCSVFPQHKMIPYLPLVGADPTIATGIFILVVFTFDTFTFSIFVFRIFVFRIFPLDIVIFGIAAFSISTFGIFTFTYHRSFSGFHFCQRLCPIPLCAHRSPVSCSTFRFNAVINSFCSSHILLYKDRCSCHQCCHNKQQDPGPCQCRRQADPPCLFCPACNCFENTFLPRVCRLITKRSFYAPQIFLQFSYRSIAVLGIDLRAAFDDLRHFSGGACSFIFRCFSQSPQQSLQQLSHGINIRPGRGLAKAVLLRCCESHGSE